MSDQPTLHMARDGTKYWYLNGKTHREDGPAIERADGTKYWYLNDKRVTGSELDVMKMRIWMETGKNYFMDKVD